MSGKQATDHLLLRNLRDEADKRRFASFNAACNNAFEGATCDCLLHHHPETTQEDYWLIEDLTTGEVVSTVCLIPWRASFCGIEIKVAQLEMVLTHRDYRGRGLVRRLIQNFTQAVKQRGYDLSLIWGIPYYYRQFGFAYSLDGNVLEALPAWRIPAASGDARLECRLRPANLEDIPGLAGLYEQAIRPLDIWLRRSPEFWAYMLQAAKHPYYIFENAASGVALGYACLVRTEERVLIYESSLVSAESALALLQSLGKTTKQEIKIAWPESGILVQIARGLGSQVVPGGQWLLQIPDVANFLSKLAPVWDARLAASPWKNLKADVIVNLYREAHRLSFSGGRLDKVESIGFVDSSMGADGGHLCIPPEAFLRLVTGYRGLEELRDAWPDIILHPEVAPLIEVLFPRLKSYLYTPYHYLGPIE